MLYEWYEKGMLMYALAAISGVGILLKFVLWRGMNGWLHTTEHMGNEGAVWIERVKQEYRECCQSYGKVNNVDIFVDKHLGSCRYFGMRLSTWGKVGGQILALMIGIVVFSIAVGIAYEQDAMRIMFEFFVGCWLVIINLIVDNLAGREEKLTQLRLNMLEYFQNHPFGMELPMTEEQKTTEQKLIEEQRYQEGLQEQPKKPRMAGAVITETAVGDCNEEVGEEPRCSEAVTSECMEEAAGTEYGKEHEELLTKDTNAVRKNIKRSDSHKKKVQSAASRREEIKQQLIREREEKRAELAREMVEKMAVINSEKKMEEKNEQGLIAEVLREFLQ